MYKLSLFTDRNNYCGGYTFSSLYGNTIFNVEKKQIRSNQNRENLQIISENMVVMMFINMRQIYFLNKILNTNIQRKI